MRTHTGEKSFKCGECSFASKYPHVLRSHMLTHTGDEPFKCSECSFATSRPSDLTKHKRRAHVDSAAQPASAPVSAVVQDAHDDDDDGSGDGTSMHSEDVLIGTDASKQHDMGDASHDSAAAAVCVKKRRVQHDSPE